MEGIRYVTDDEGHKVAVLIDLERYGELWEDFQDQLVAEERKDEERIPLSQLRKRLLKAGKIE
ncbi:MAG: hypothetical protein KY432_00790 [Acidobacteria bacterium]|nr:hypothetical protein [Acidobacteriota bacterium]